MREYQVSSATDEKSENYYSIMRSKNGIVSGVVERDCTCASSGVTKTKITVPNPLF